MRGSTFVFGGTLQFATDTTTTPIAAPSTTEYVVAPTTQYWTTVTTVSNPDAPGATYPAYAPPENAVKSFLLHTKFWPKYNDENLISHADDQIRQQYTATASLSELVSSPPHESTGFPVGNAVESYQGYKTVEVWIRQVHLGWPDTEGNCQSTPHGYDSDTGLGAGTGEWKQLAAEQNIEKLKLVEWATAGSSTWELQFLFRTKTGGYFNGLMDSEGNGPGIVRQYVHVAWHDSCTS